MAKSLAVKYRPRTLDEVVGQTQAVKALSTIFKTRKLPAAILLAGNSGCGKTTIARIIARTLNCQNKTLCGKKDKCDSCTIIDNNPKLHPDFKNANAGTQGGKDDIRALVELSRYAPSYKTRVILIDEAHNMTPQGQQALLLDLEEPSENTLWILATTDPHKLAVAMKGRCQPMTLGPVDTKVLAERIKYVAKKEGHKLKDKICVKIAEYSGGQVRDSLTALENIFNIVASDKKVNIDKAIEEMFFNDGDLEQSAAIASLLVALYEDKPAPALKFIGMLTDYVGAVTKMGFMNGFLQFSILKMSDRNIRSPYYPSPENRMLWDALSPDLKDDKKRKAVFRKSIEVSGKVVDLRKDLMTAGIADPTSIVVSHLLR